MEVTPCKTMLDKIVVKAMTRAQYYKLMSIAGDHAIFKDYKSGPQIFLPRRVRVVDAIINNFPDVSVHPDIKASIKVAKADHKGLPGYKVIIAKIKRQKNWNTRGYKFRTTPWHHQKRGFALITSCPSVALLWDMRTGKTYAVSASIEYLKQQGCAMKTLVICPKDLRPTWVKDVTEHTDLKCIILGEETKKQIVTLRRNDLVTVVDGPNIYNTLGNADIYITNHDAIRNEGFLQALIDFGFNMVVVDESQMFKNTATKRTMALLRLKNHIERRIALTGTISPSNPLDVYAQMNFINGFIFPESEAKFKKRYCIYRPFGQIEIFVRPNRAFQRELWRRVDEFSDKVKIEDCHDMPKKHYTTINVTLNSEERRLHDELCDELATELESGDVIETTVLQKARKLTQITSGCVYTGNGEIRRIKNSSKVKALKDFLEQTLSIPERKIIIWAGYHGTVGLIEDLLIEMKIKHSIVSGLHKMSAIEKHQAIWNFRNTDVQVLVANPSMIGIGVDLPEAMYAVYYENDFRYDLRAQSEARNFGHKAKSLHGDRIVYVDFVARDSADELILAAIKKKKDFQKFMNAKALRGVGNSTKTGKTGVIVKGY